MAHDRHKRSQDWTAVHVVPAISTAAVSAGRYLTPMSQATPERRIIPDTNRNATRMFVWPPMYPSSQNACTSPSAWMTKMFAANAVARTAGSDTLASAVFEGPVFRNRKKMATNIVIQAAGKGM